MFFMLSSLPVWFGVYTVYNSSIHWAPGHGLAMYLAILAECQSRDLLGMATPVPLGARMQVLHHH